MEWEKETNVLLVLVNNELIIVFETKTKICKKYFDSQYIIISNNSILYLSLNHLTDDKLSSFNTSSGAIFQKIKNSDPNKDHGHNKICKNP